MLDDVVEPGAADLGRREVGPGTVLLQGSEEDEGSGDVVVGDDQRLAQPVVDVAGDRAEFGHDALVGPALERPAQVDAHDLAEHAGIDPFEVVAREGHG